MKTRKEQQEALKNSNATTVLGKNIRYFRLTNTKYSQETLAEKIDIHRNHVGLIERGLTNTCILNIEKISKALKVKLADLFAEPAHEVEIDKNKPFNAIKN